MEMVCGYCKTENFDSASVCITCGIPLSEANRPAMHQEVRYVYRPYANVPPVRDGARFRFRIQPRARVNVRPSLAEAPVADPGVEPASTEGIASASTPGMEPRLVNDAARTEPDAGPRHTAYSASDAFGGASISAGEARPLFATTSSRVVFVMACFALAIGAGLFGAWWLNDPAAARALAAMRKSAQAPDSAAVKPLQTPQARQTFGISAGELPYDGVPPDPPLATPTPADAAIKPRDLPHENLKSDDVDSGTENAVPIERSVAPSGPPQEEAAATTGDGGPNNSAQPLQVKPRDKPVKPVSPVQRQGANPKFARNKEIGRLQQQAEDELKKKTERRRSLVQSVTKAHQTARRREAEAAASRRKPIVKPVPVARCGTIASLLAREVCKWRICKNQWGKNGCPSYAKPENY